MSSAVVFEMTNPGWQDMPEYQDGPAGQLIAFCEERGYGNFVSLLEGAEDQIKEEQRDAEGDPFAFLRMRCKNGKTWKEYCKNQEPTSDKDGFINGAWGSCLTAAVIFEHQNPEWSQLPAYCADGPAGQVIAFFSECGHSAEEALNRTEEATHQAIDRGNEVPVFEDVYYPVVGQEDAPTCGGDPPAMTGKKKALLVGINYFGTSAELGGCINDTNQWKELLTEVYGFQDDDIVMLTDDQGDEKKPTLNNMRQGLRWLVAGAGPGDVLFWQYSGHGSQQTCQTNCEADGKDETLCPCNYTSGMLVDDEIFDTVVMPLPDGVKLTIILDCCHSGTAVDLPFSWSDEGNWEEVDGTSHSAGDVQMFSGCEDDQTSADVSMGGKRGGAMTLAMTKAIREDPSRNYPDLLDRLRDILQERGMEQRPRLTSSQQFDPNGKQFDLTQGAVPNTNPQLGSSGSHRTHDARAAAVF